MKIKRPIAPGFINKLDEYLLLNKPDTWSARAHLVVYYGLLFMIMLFLIGFVVPNEPRNRSNIETWVVLVSIISFISLIIWLIYLLRFNVFKRFGLVIAGDRIKTFFLYFLAVGIMVSWPFIPTITETIRANQAYGNDELVTDANNMNIKILQLERDSIPLRWRNDTFVVRSKVLAYERENNGLESAEQAAVEVNDNGTNAYERSKTLIDTAELKTKLLEADSVQQLNDSNYVFYNCPFYQFVQVYKAEEASLKKLLSSPRLYEQVLKNYQKPNTEKTLKELNLLLNKYRLPSDRSYYYNEYADNDPKKALQKYQLGLINSNLSNITTKKYRWEKTEWPDYFRIFFYTSFLISLLVFVFRHTTIRTYFLTLLSGLLLLICTTAVTALFNARVTAIEIIMLLYYLLFLVLALWGVKKKTRSAVSGIALNLLVASTAFIPLLATALYYSIQHEQYIGSGDYGESYQKRFALEKLHYLYAEIIGFIVFFFLVEYLFKQLYRTWYSRPEQ
jgi:hypothetical protein